VRFEPTARLARHLELGGYVSFSDHPVSEVHHVAIASGAGLQVGLDADFRARLASHLGLVTKIGFLAQPVGTATFPDDVRNGKSVSFAFKPAFYVGTGPELFF
jgi:hypothetical protein